MKIHPDPPACRELIDMAEHIQLLVIEDNRVFAGIVHLLLSAADDVNFDVTIAATLREGLVKLSTESFQMVLLDLNLPNGEGMVVVNAIMGAVGDRIPVVVLTGLDNETLGVRALKAGVAEYLVKTVFDSRKLASTLKSVYARFMAAKRANEVMKDVTETLEDVQQTLDTLKDIMPKPAPAADTPEEKKHANERSV
jgi:DNA-binding response OmpR family regulator